MVQGKGKCRLGWYAQTMESFLRNSGYLVEVVSFDSPFPLNSKGKIFLPVGNVLWDRPIWLQFFKAILGALQKQVLLDKSLDILRRFGQGKLEALGMQGMNSL